MTSIRVIVNQLLFFAMSDIAFCENNSEKITALVGLNSLLLYYIITYFVQRVIDITTNMKSNNNHKSSSSLSLCIFKIILEWCKAIIIIICLKEQGLKIHPYLIYNFITCIYYLATESVYNIFYPSLIKYFHLDFFEGLEELYVPISLELFTILLSIILFPIVLVYNTNLSIICLYHVIYLQLKDLYKSYWNEIQHNRKIMINFKNASKEDLENWNDVCAICINEMKYARKTSCGHLFHAECLRKCIQNSQNCPLCKTIIYD